MEGSWQDQHPHPGSQNHGNFRIGCWEIGQMVSGWMTPATIEFKGTITEGLWGVPGTKTHHFRLAATEPKIRPWYNYPWNLPDYPWDAPADNLPWNIPSDDPPV
jgi:hypothetical protein